MGTHPEATPSPVATMQKDRWLPMHVACAVLRLTPTQLRALAGCRIDVRVAGGKERVRLVERLRDEPTMNRALAAPSIPNRILRAAIESEGGVARSNVDAAAVIDWTVASDDAVRAALHAWAEEMPRVVPDAPNEPDEYMTMTRIGDHLGASARAVGQALRSCGVYDAPGWFVDVERTITTSKGHQKRVPLRLFRRSVVDLLRERAAGFYDAGRGHDRPA